jgi:hypothetical protein
MAEKSCSKAARYMRLYRARLRKKLAVLHVTIHSDRFIAALLDSRLLTPEEALDKANAEAAAGSLLDEWARR